MTAPMTGRDERTYDFDAVVDRRRDPWSYSFKWSDAPFLAQHAGVEKITDDFIPMFTADMDFRCAQPIVEALMATAAHGVFGYSGVMGNQRYLDAVTGWFARRDGWDVDPERLRCAPGTVTALSNCVRAFTAPGEAVIVQRPVYPPFSAVVKENDRELLDNHLVRGEGLRYEMDLEGLERLCARPEATLMLLCSPHNPVGRVWSADELRELARICGRNGVRVIADEIHGDLTRRGQAMTHLAQVVDDLPAGERPQVVTCTAVNKTFNLAGLAATNLVFGDAADQRRYMRFGGHTGTSPFAISAVVAAYEQGEPWLEQLRAYLDQTIDEVIGYFGERLPDVGVRRPEGTYVLWFDFEDRCRALGIDGAGLHERIYARAHVLLQDGTDFDPQGGEFFQRMCVPAPRKLVMEACRRICDQLAG